MSRQICSFLILILLSMQTCLLDARRLRVAMRSAVVSYYHDNNPFSHPTDATTSTSNGDSDNTVPPSNEPSSCTPHQHQMKYYKRLYNSSSSNTFNGNILYYALKAVKTHENRTEQAITAEDNATIANISDLSRFIPAGMQTANKVVCAKILQEMDGLLSNTALCAWDYVCDYEADRYPHYLFKARCKSAQCNITCSPDKKHTMCQSHGIHVTVLVKRECNKWVWDQVLIPLACTCTNEAVMKAESGMSG